MNLPNLPHVICPECGAENNHFANNCWICRRPLYDDDEIVDAECVSSVSVPRQQRLGRVFAILSFFTLLFGGLLVGFGVGIDKPSLAIVYALVTVPMVLSISYLIFKGNTSGSGIWSSISMAVSAVIVTVGLLFLLGIAALIALFAFCLMVMAGAH